MDDETRKAIHQIRESMQNMQLANSKAQAELAMALAVLTQRFQSMEQELSKNLVPRPEFMPVKYIAFGLAGATLSGTVGAVLSLVFSQ